MRNDDKVDFEDQHFSALARSFNMNPRLVELIVKDLLHLYMKVVPLIGLLVRRSGFRS